MEQNDQDHKRIEKKQDNICGKIDDLDKKFDEAISEKVNKEDFYFWRNLLISGLVLGIFMMILSTVIS